MRRRHRSQRGFTLVELVVVVAVIAIIASIAIPMVASSRKAANEASAVNSLRTLTTANQAYRARFQLYPATLPVLQASGYIDSALGSGQKSGYVFAYSAGTNTWGVSSTPVDPAHSGDRSFWVDESGVIRVSETAPASSASAPID